MRMAKYIPSGMIILWYQKMSASSINTGVVIRLSIESLDVPPPSFIQTKLISTEDNSGVQTLQNIYLNRPLEARIIAKAPLQRFDSVVVVPGPGTQLFTPWETSQVAPLGEEGNPLVVALWFAKFFGDVRFLLGGMLSFVRIRLVVRQALLGFTSTVLSSVRFHLVACQALLGFTQWHVSLCQVSLGGMLHSKRVNTFLFYTMSLMNQRKATQISLSEFCLDNSIEA